MSIDPKPSTPAGAGTATALQDHGIRVFTWPKVIFMFPTLIVSLICGVGMMALGDNKPDSPAEASAKANAEVRDEVKAGAKVDTKAGGAPSGKELSMAARVDRFKEPANLLGVLFLGVFAFNLVIMGVDFPRFTIVAIVFVLLFFLFFFLWLGVYFDLDLMRSVRVLMAGVYATANASFYFMIAGILMILFAVIYLTRWLDYYQILPNEILHHHGPMSDLERFPTMNLKFDKEIPDVLEFLFLGAGRLVLHVTEERKSIVLDNVLFINSVEYRLKNVMSRMNVRITTDKEVSDL